MAKIVPNSEIQDFMFKLIKSGVMCSERRLDSLEKITWDEYLDTENKSRNYRYYIHRLPEFYVAAKGNSNAKINEYAGRKIIVFYPLSIP